MQWLVQKLITDEIRQKNFLRRFFNLNLAVCSHYFRCGHPRLLTAKKVQKILIFKLLTILYNWIFSQKKKHLLYSI